jgi:hypothetical protein
VARPLVGFTVQGTIMSPAINSRLISTTRDTKSAHSDLEATRKTSEVMFISCTGASASLPSSVCSRIARSSTGYPDRSKMTPFHFPVGKPRRDPHPSVSSECSTLSRDTLDEAAFELRGGMGRHGPLFPVAVM